MSNIWAIHIDNLAKKISRAIGVMFRVRCFVSKNILTNLYPHILYAIPIWGNTFESYIEKLIILQKKTVRMMTFNLTFFSEMGPPVHAAPLFKRLKILNLNAVFELRVAKLFYDCIHNLAPNQFNDWFSLISNIHSQGTRVNVADTRELDTSGNLFIPYVRTTHYGLRSTKVCGHKIWNLIPCPIKKAKSRVSFGKSFKNTLHSTKSRCDWLVIM